VNLVLALGLSVDYSAHLAHRFVVTNSDTSLTPQHHLSDALWRLGASVLNGGISTFLAVLPLSLAVSTVFQTFFKMMATIVRRVPLLRLHPSQWPVCCHGT